GERDDGAASVGGDIAAKRRHLDGLAVGDRRDRAVLDAGGYGRDVGGVETAHHFGGHGWRRDVDVLDRRAEKRVPHRAADKARGAAVHRERIHHGAHMRGVHPRIGRRIEFGSHGEGAGAGDVNGGGVGGGGSKCPGTTLPCSFCAGT